MNQEEFSVGRFYDLIGPFSRSFCRICFCLNALMPFVTFFFSVFFQPPKIKSFIHSVTSIPLENIEEPLRSFVWEYDKVKSESLFD